MGENQRKILNMFDTPDQMVAFLKGAEDPAYTEAIQQIEDGLATVQDQEPSEVLGTVKEMGGAVFTMVKDMLDKVFAELDVNGDERLERAEVDAFCQKIKDRIMGDMDAALERA